MATSFPQITERLQAGEHFYIGDGELLYDLFYTRADSVYWLQVGQERPSPFFSLHGLIAGLLERIGSWEKESERDA
jgi:hypothetical protein